MARLLQNAVSKNATQFKGNAQHDAQEFLLWLLDRVHEDLNTVNPNIRPAVKVFISLQAGVSCYGRLLLYCFIEKHGPVLLFSYLGSSNKVVPGHFTCITLQLSGVYNDSGPCSHIPGDGDAPGLVFPPRGSDLNPVVVIKTCKSDQ